MYPDPRVDEGRVPPFHISLAAWAVDIAADLHKQFGDDVDLHVGFQDYPSGAIRGPDTTNVRPRLLPDEIEVSIEDGIEIKSGHDASIEMHLANHGPEQIVLHNVVAQVIDPETHRVIASGDRIARFSARLRMEVTLRKGAELASFRKVVLPGEGWRGAG
jgi:hypothetical protein